jgi:Secretion system C-terminal sorting domain
MKKMSTIFLLFFSCGFTPIYSQLKHDNKWIIGYDTSSIDNIGNALQITFQSCQPISSFVNSVSNYHMEGTNASICSSSGNLLLYTNGCKIINASGATMTNGDGINPGLIESIYCQSGGSPYIQGAISIPASGSDSLYYVFNLDMDQPYFMVSNFLGVAPQRLFYQLIDITSSGGLGKVILKNQVAIQDTFARGCLKAVHHTNGEDWWVIVPKSHSNCYFVQLVTSQGIQPPVLKCSGRIWNDSDLTQSVFSPDGTKYVRCNKENGLNILDFDSSTGDFSNPIIIDFPNDTFSIAGVAISSNSRFLYLSARKNLYQFDLNSPNIEASKILIGEWDGYSNPYPTIFYISALAPDNKIYISSTSSHKYLHVIHSPDSLGFACNLEQRGLELPAYNFASIPNFPHYRKESTQCEPISNINVNKPLSPKVSIYPNPTLGKIWIQVPEIDYPHINFSVLNTFGQVVYEVKIAQSLTNFDLTHLPLGTYFYRFSKGNEALSGKIVKVE